MYRILITASGATPERTLAEIRQALALLEININGVDRYPINENITISETEYLNIYARFKNESTPVC